MLIWAILLALLPGLAWLIFYLQEDLHPEPKSLLAAVFVTGGAFAFFALALQIIMQKFGVLDPGDAVAHNSFWIFPLSLFLFSLTEEFFKFAAAYVNVRRKEDFDEPIDAMIYVVVAGLGFATIENIGTITPGMGEAVNLSLAFQTLSLRFIGATLLHALTAGIVGYYWAVSIRDFELKRYLVFGLVLAAALHAFFNYLIINFSDLIYALVFLLIIGFFVLHDFERLKLKSI